jgi:4,5-DOPA dioxygenase extradiol
MTPVLFVSHGAPTALFDRGDYAQHLREFGASVAPRAIVIISAHWISGRRLLISSAEHPETIHDFSGFGDELKRFLYPAPGDPKLAVTLATHLTAAGFAPHFLSRGLDHGAWVPLHHLYSAADVPVVSVSLPETFTVAEWRKFGAALRPLRKDGVLFIGSGGMVHNLGAINYHASGAPPKWATEFEAEALKRVTKSDLEGLMALVATPLGHQAHPTDDHFLPLVVAGSLADRDATPGVVHAGFTFENLSMLTLAWRGGD